MTAAPEETTTQDTDTRPCRFGRISGTVDTDDTVEQCPNPATWSCLFHWQPGADRHDDVVNACTEHKDVVVSAGGIICQGCMSTAVLVETVPLP